MNVLVAAMNPDRMQTPTARNERGDPTLRQRAKRPALTLRVVIGIFSAFIVLFVAATTFAITYTQSLATVEAIGRRYALSIVDAGRIRVEDFFAIPAAQAVTVARAMRQDFARLPSDDPTDFGVLQKAVDYLLSTILFDPSVTSTAFTLFDDGSVVTARFSTPALLEVSLTNGRTLNGTTGCCAFGYSDMLNFPAMTLARARTSFANYSDARVALYSVVRPILAGGEFGVWQPAVYYRNMAPPVYAMPAMYPMRNRTHFLGVIGTLTSLANISSFLRQLEVTVNSRIFAVDSTEAIVATTHSTSFETFTETTSTVLLPGMKSNCAHSGSTSPLSDKYVIVCRTVASQFPWPPLQQAVKKPLLAKPGQGSRNVEKITTSDGTYYAASAGVGNQFRLFTFTLILLMPERDILGDIVTARNLVIGIVIAIFFVAVAISIAFTSFVLAPLRRVTAMMGRTARLRDVSDDSEDNFSHLAEIHDIQHAYQGMNSAIKSFTRYVPRDVVKDLMWSGQLGEINMLTMRCSMLFVDIAGFTTMCERVWAEELSQLVRAYFERMSGIVTAHDGLIDKFIGDCIMAVWGAPLPVPNQEIKSTLCAVLIHRETRVKPLLDAFDRAGEVLHVRVGVATGEVLAGNMGSTDRMSYTVIGDSVNLAARLEALNKQFDTHVMVPDETASGLHGVFVLRLLLRITVVGRADPVQVYEVVGLSRNVGPQAFAAIRAADVRPAGDDNASLSSNLSLENASVIGAMHRRGRREASTLSMLERAMGLSDGPVVVPDSFAAMCATYTHATRLYAEAKFAEALSALDSLERGDEPGGVDDFAHAPMSSGKAYRLLRGLCEECLQRPPVDFDGVWHTTDK
jgi:class 3 adenylate cyclase